MKNNIIRITSFIIVLVIIVSCAGLTITNDELITLGEAEQTAAALFSTLTGINNWDDIIHTPLFNKDNECTYYCFGFTRNGDGVGYILIAANISYELISEYSDAGYSIYYINFLNGKQNIYYNPIQL